MPDAALDMYIVHCTITRIFDRDMKKNFGAAFVPEQFLKLIGALKKANRLKFGNSFAHVQKVLI